MVKTKLYKQDGAENGDIKLNDSIFGITPNNSVVFDAVVMQQASLRQGTHMTKNRSAVSGGGKKPWRQKGTGRARQGSIRAPQWRGGGIVNGPSPRSYGYKLNKKVRRLAIKSVLSQKVLDNDIYVIDSFNLEIPNTKNFIKILESLNIINNKILFVVDENNNNAVLSSRNLSNVKSIYTDDINVLDVIDSEKLILTKTALLKLEEALV